MTRDQQGTVYEGLLAVLLRLVFLLYAEDRGLIPRGTMRWRAPSTIRDRRANVACATA